MRRTHSIKRIFLTLLLTMTVLIFALQAGYTFFQYKHLAESQIQERLLLQAKDSANDINRQLIPIAQKAEQMAYYIEALPTYDTDMIVQIIRHYISHDRLIFGSGFWLEPYIYSPDRLFYGPYVYQKETGESVLTWEYSTPEYNYLHWEWYRKGYTAERVSWSEPYYDYVSGISMITAASPIHKNGAVVGVTSVDLYITAFLDRIAALPVGRNGYAFVIDSSGLYLSHRHPEKVLKLGLTTEEDPSWHELANAITRSSGQGFLRTTLDQQEVFAVFTPIGETPMRLVLILPVAEAYEDLTHIFQLNLLAFLVALVVFVFVLLYLFRQRIDLPLRTLQLQVQALENSPFSAPASLKSEAAAPSELYSLYCSFESLDFKIRHAMISLQESNDALSESENRWTLALKGSNDGIWDWTIPDHHLFLSSQVLRILGEDPQDRQLMASDFEQWIYASDLANVRHAFRSHLRNPIEPLELECRIHSSDQRIRWILIRGQCLLSSTGRPLRMVGSIGDITIRKETESSLRSSQEKFSKAFYFAADVIGIVRLEDEVYLETSEAFFSRLGYQRNEVIGQSSLQFELWESLEARSSFYDRLKKEGALRDVETYWFTKSRQTRIGLCSAEIILINETSCLLYAWHDITEQKNLEFELRSARADLEEKVIRRTHELVVANQELTATLNQLQTAQEQLIQSERLSALASLVAGVAHEINTPIGVAVTAASHLEEDTRQFNTAFANGFLKKQQLIDYLNSAQETSRILSRSLSRAAHLIRSFKQVSVDQASESRRKFLVKEYLEEILLTLHPKLKQTKLDIVVDCSAKLSLDSFPGAFAQIITNLIMNSLYHAYPGKSKAGTIRIEAVERAATLFLTYRDDGKGMTNEIRARIFEPFFTTNRNTGGSGLGLYILHNIVTQQFGGRIDCESQPEQGTTFFIQLPLRDSHLE